LRKIHRNEAGIHDALGQKASLLLTFSKSFVGRWRFVAFSVVVVMVGQRLASGGELADAKATATTEEENWSIHGQNTDVVQGHPSFSALYSGPNSLDSGAQIKETVSVDLLLGLRLWSGAEVHLDGLMYQGFGLSNALGVAGFPNGEAFRVGTHAPNGNVVRAFIRQTFGLGGEQEAAPDDPLHLVGKQDISRITLTAGRFSAKDIFDNNAYANDPRSQFLNWSLMANGAWDYPADSLGFTTGFAAELNQKQWALRYGIFQVPKVSNSIALDPHIDKAWSMVTEFEHRHSIGEHPGVVRLLGFLERAHMGDFEEALANPERPADIAATREYRLKPGICLNMEQEITKDVGVFTRLGWNNGRYEPWAFTDVDRTASVGAGVKGGAWSRPDDTVGVAGVLNGISSSHQRFLAAGGTGILVGDGTLTYAGEKIIEAYYDVQLRKWLHVALDYQFVADPAYNSDRGPVSVFGARLHWEF
jgi:high affinity Mn2+ porin